MNHLLFLLGFCFLLAHEMDAIRAEEWKMFPVLNRMEDETGYLVFTALHIPVYVLLLWGIYGGGDVNHSLVASLDIFFVVHVLLHVVFYGHPENRFRTIFSYVLIFGAGMFGAADLFLR